MPIHRRSTLPDRVRDARISAGLSQHELEQASGLAQRHVSAIERGRDPRATTLAKLARVLRVSTDWLLGLSDTP